MTGRPVSSSAEVSRVAVRLGSDGLSGIVTLAGLRCVPQGVVVGQAVQGFTLWAPVAFAREANSQVVGDE